MATPTKPAARAIKTAQQHAAAGNPESASRVLGAAWRAALQKRDSLAIEAAAREIGCGLYACTAAVR